MTATERPETTRPVDPGATPPDGGDAAAADQRPARRGLLADPVPWLALVAAFAADQITKAAVVANLPYRQSWPEEGFFRLTHTWNTGTAFGLFPQYGGLLTIISLAAVVVLFLFYRAAGSPSLLLRAAFGMQLGGAFGNLFDRFRLGHVTDFIDVGPWPVFNIADSCIVVGIALMAYHFWTASGERAAPVRGAAARDAGGDVATAGPRATPATPQPPAGTGSPDV